MTIQQARKILGNLADNVSDDLIEKDIKVAEMLKNLFFAYYSGSKLSQGNYNKNGNGKT